MDYEQKMALLANCKPEYKDALLLRILKGEKVDITQDSDLFYQINADRVSMDEFTNRDKFKAAAKQVKHMNDNLDNKGYTKDKKMRWMGDIPAEIFFSRPEFSPTISKEERDANIRKWLQQFPSFKRDV